MKFRIRLERYVQQSVEIEVEAVTIEAALENVRNDLDEDPVLEDAVWDEEDCLCDGARVYGIGVVGEKEFACDISEALDPLHDGMHLWVETTL